MTKKKIIEVHEPYEKMNFSKVAYEVLLDSVRSEAMALVESTNEDPLRYIHQVESKKDCSCSTSAASFTDDVRAIREDLTTDRRDEVTPYRDVIEPKKASKQIKKMSRSKLHNMIKNEILKQVNHNKIKERRHAALKKLLPLKK
ncbi:MAG: hypothetical protein ACON43_02560 [Flavobacteriaceae bacterium]